MEEIKTNGIIKINPKNPFYWVCSAIEDASKDYIRVSHTPEEFSSLEEALNRIKSTNCKRKDVDLVRKIDILSPISPPKNLIGTAWNYREHADETGYSGSPAFFPISPEAIAQPFSTLNIEEDNLMDYEVELGVVIAKEINRESSFTDIHEFIAGYVLGNDITSRRIQVEQSAIIRKSEGCCSAKSLPNSKPIGPILFVGPLQHINLELKIYREKSEETRQSSSTSQMYFTPEELVSYLSDSIKFKNGRYLFSGFPFKRLLKDNCLFPGDVILTGNPRGKAFQTSARDVFFSGGRRRFLQKELSNNPKYLKKGDRVYASAECLGWQETNII